MDLFSHQVLRTDTSGMPLEWINYQEAAKLYHLEQVVYACGIQLYTIHGGANARTGLRSARKESLFSDRLLARRTAGRPLSYLSSTRAEMLSL